MDLRLHVGAWPDHFLFDPQTLVLSPTNMNPELQKYRAVEPSLLPLLSLRKPLFGAGRLGQSTGPSWVEGGKSSKEFMKHIVVIIIV